MASVHIGLDLDNTLVDYDQVFPEVCCEIGLLPHDHGLQTKERVKARLRAGPGGDEAWMRLQGQVYGRYIGRAQLFDGAAEFLKAVRAAGARISIVSHKTRYGHFDPERIDLWQAALDWLERQGFFAADGFGLDRRDVHFRETRGGKIAAIAETGCDVFVDDLPEVLCDPRFPPDVAKFWFAGRQGSHEGEGDLKPHPSWADILAAIGPRLENAPDGAAGGLDSPAAMQ